MSCAYKASSSPTILQQSSPVWPAQPAFMKAINAIADILQEAIELSRTCSHMAQRRRERQALLDLDDWLLDDIGVTREQAERQARKWFWQ
jgi:uncharacterized protein YjiS (DUF1127 family)